MKMFILTLSDIAGVIILAIVIGYIVYLFSYRFILDHGDKKTPKSPDVAKKNMTTKKATKAMPTRSDRFIIWASIAVFAIFMLYMITTILALK